jgi:hypothetical protein
MATTTSKMAILDYLWEWTKEYGSWAKLLVKKIINLEDSLSDEELVSVYDEFLNNIFQSDKKPTVDIERPSLTFDTTNLQLLSMSEIEGVNKLAPGQILDFSNNITVIYGANATGKSGYSRILKTLGLCYQKENKVLCNVYDTGEKNQKAKIKYMLNNKFGEFTWDGTCQSSELRYLSIFTNDCVNISIGRKRDLLVTPIGFHLFEILSNDLDRLAKIHKTKIENCKQEIPWIENLHQETEVYNFITDLNAQSSVDKFNSLKSYSLDDEKDLAKLTKQRANLNKNLLETQISFLSKQVKELVRVKLQIRTIQHNFKSEDWTNIINYEKKIDELSKKEQIGLEKIAEERGIALYKTKEFNDFIKAAEKYIQKLDKKDYPKDKDETCVYCGQKLTDRDARELLTNYRILLNDTTQTEIREYMKLLKILREKIININSNIKLYYASFGENEKKESIQPKFLEQFCKIINEFKELAGTKKVNIIQENKFNIDYKKIKTKIDKKLKSIKFELKNKKEILTQIEQREVKIDSQINKLLDRKLLNKKQPEIENNLVLLKQAQVLRSMSHLFNTDSVSRKTTTARKDLISTSFEKIFTEELKSLSRSNTKLSLNFETSKAKSILKQEIKSQYALNDILSEGEQKSIALAEFLTEVQLDNENKASIIFDDPVTSLDHKIIDEFARRLVQLSKERQVILFTHSIIFFNSIKQKSDLPRFKDLKFKYYETETDLENTGFLYESPTLREDNFNKYKKSINEILNLPKEKRDRKESELAISGYNKLRPAIEVFVENEILFDTVKRYRKNVALTSLEKINGALIDKHKEQLTNIFEKCCEYIEAHSNPETINAKPTLVELENDFNEVCRIRSEFVK